MSGIERRLNGIGVSPGLAAGPAYRAQAPSPKYERYQIAAAEVPAELARFALAVEASRRQLSRLRDRSANLPAAASEELGFLLDAALAMLGGSRLIRGIEARIREERANAEAAVEDVVGVLAAQFTEVEDPYLAARGEDIRLIGTRLLRSLTGTPHTGFGAIPAGSILIAGELTPGDTALLDPARVLGFATEFGGAEGHTAIMARALGIPAVLGCAALLDTIPDGAEVLIDGAAGSVIASPSPQAVARFEADRLRLREDRLQLQRLATLPSVTRDHVRVELHANLELPQEVEAALAVGAEGLGLVRTEFLFMNRTSLPSEEEQIETLSELCRGMGGREVTIRTLDIGGDKLAGLAGTDSDDRDSALGLRAIRFGLKHPELMRTQLRAILRVSVEAPVRILLPMISRGDQIRSVRQMMHEAARDLGMTREAGSGSLPPLGIMIEIPGAALNADALSRLCDFFAIGTNDLTQYTLAVDRADQQVADLYNPYHPAVLRLIQFATQAAKRAEIPVSLCGEMAGDPRGTALLLGLGIRNFSLTPASLPAVKQRIRDLRLSDAIAFAGGVMDEGDETIVARLLDEALTRPA